MKIKDDIFLKLNPYSPPENDKWAEHMTDEIVQIIEKRIDSIIDRLDSHDDKIKISTLKQVKELLK